MKNNVYSLLENASKNRLNNISSIWYDLFFISPPYLYLWKTIFIFEALILFHHCIYILLLDPPCYNPPCLPLVNELDYTGL